MLFDRLDRSRLRRDIAELTLQCLSLKQVLRRTWTEPMAESQRRLLRAQRNVTELLVLLALSRKRLHVRRPPRDLPPSEEAWSAEAHNLRIAERVARDYALPSEHQEIAAP
ncbi:MAG: hypothetical protein U0359_22230 [Byssovorax sp.]